MFFTRLSAFLPRAFVYIAYMINFFWPLLDLYDDPEFSVILCMFILAFLPHLLGFLFALFYEKFRLKKLWLSLWSILLGALVCGYVIFVYKVDEDIMVEHFISIELTFLLLFLYIAFFLVCSLFGKNFNPKKLYCKLSLPLVVIIPMLLFWSFGWSLLAHPYGEISDEPLDQTTLSESQGADYEMIFSTADAWGNDSRSVSFLERNDSVFFQFGYSECADVQYDTTKNLLTVRHGDDSVGDWILLDAEKLAIVRKLKKSVEKYSREYTMDDVLDGYGSSIVLRDYKRKTRHRLYFPNAKHSSVYDAIAIEKTFESFIPPRDSYTSLSYRDVSKKCADSQNELVVRMTLGKPDSSIKTKHPERRRAGQKKEIEPRD